MSQQSCKNLSLAIAQETVCVHRVVVTIETQPYHVRGILNLIQSLKCDLGGRPPEIKRSHCGPAGVKPASHKTILQINNEAEVKGEFPVHLPEFFGWFFLILMTLLETNSRCENWNCQIIQLSALFNLRRSIKKWQNNICVIKLWSQTTQPLRSSLRDS